MYSIKRLKLFSGISDGRKSRDKHKYQLLNHIVLFMLSSKRLNYDNHWRNEVVNFINSSISGYDNRSFIKNFDFNELFDDFINKGKDYNSFISRLKEKFREERKNDINNSIEYPEDFINSYLLIDILKELSNKLNSWKKRNNRKPSLNSDLNDGDSEEFFDILYNIRYSYKSDLDKYSLKYKIRHYSLL